MPPGSEVLGDGAIRREKALGMTGGFEPLHATLPLTRWAMGVLTPIIEVATLPVFHPWEYLAFGGPVALQLIRDDHAGHIPQALEQLAEELLRSLFVAPALHQDIKEVVVLIHRPPQVMTLAVDGQKHLIQMPRVTGPRPTAPELIGVVLPELQTPLANGLISDVNTAFEQKLLHVAVAQREAIVEPDPVADNLVVISM